MKKWLVRKLQDFRFKKQIADTDNAITAFSAMERGYILLFVAMLRQHADSDGPEVCASLDDPRRFHREELLQLYYPFEDMRNTTLLYFEKLSSDPMMPEAATKHVFYSLHSLNVLLATLAAALVNEKKDCTRRMWMTLQESHAALPESMNRFRIALRTQMELRNEAVSVPFHTDESWIKAAKWIPSSF